MFRRRLARFAVGAALLAAVAIVPSPIGADAGPPPVCGRWDLIVQGAHGDYPSWLEVRLSGRSTLVGSYVGHFGMPRPISRVEFDGAHVHFSVPRNGNPARMTLSSTANWTANRSGARRPTTTASA